VECYAHRSGGVVEQSSGSSARTRRAGAYSDEPSPNTSTPERRLGRVTRDADTDPLTTALIAIIHHLLLTHSRKRDPRRDLRRVIKAVIAGITPRAERERRLRRRPAR
jgi:hypothetical protein